MIFFSSAIHMPEIEASFLRCRIARGNNVVIVAKVMAIPVIAIEHDAEVASAVGLTSEEVSVAGHPCDVVVVRLMEDEFFHLLTGDTVVGDVLLVLVIPPK